MEPTSQPIRYIVHSRVYDVRENTTQVYVSGVGRETVFDIKSLGWFLYLEGSHEAIYLGNDKPSLQAGDRVKITFEKVQA